MQNDKTTLRDLSIFTSDGSDGVFNLLDRTTTQVGRDMLRRHIQQPPATYEHLKEVQDVTRFWSVNSHLWPTIILNGTIVMLEKYFESADAIANPPDGFTLVLNSFFQKIFNRQEYFFIRFSLSHLADLIKGCGELVALAEKPGLPQLLLKELEMIRNELQHPLAKQVLGITKTSKYSELKRLNYKVRRELKSLVTRLVHSYAKLDAWQAMGRATTEHKWIFPDLLPEQPVIFEAAGLSHPLLQHPVAHDIAFSNNRNFLVLTGANMSGKTTFMRSIGVGALLAHLGMGVPARYMKISFLHGVITNMHVEDNILKGESYFFAEVQRMKQTAEKLTHKEPHLVLMDELFKGTNVHDAYECTRAVADGLLNHNNHLMILSTHLYEVAQQFSGNPAILFSYFVTTMSEDGGYKFTYELKPGISNDRIGYLILQKEGVIELLTNKRMRKQ